MNYIKISRYDIANGKGIRTVLWVSGCNHMCKNCHNKMTWDSKAGKPITQEVIDILREDLSKPYIDGITFSGGDPLFPDNRSDTTRIIKSLKEEFPNKSIWLYTGYTYEDIQDLEVIKYIDVLVDGEYQEENRNISLPFCGSDNQRVIDVKRTLSENKICTIIM